MLHRKLQDALVYLLATGTSQENYGVGKGAGGGGEGEMKERERKSITGYSPVPVGPSPGAYLGSGY